MGPWHASPRFTPKPLSTRDPGVADGSRRETRATGDPDGQRGRGSTGGGIMKLPPISPAAFERVLHHLLSVRGMDPDDAMDWIEGHYDVQESNEAIVCETK